tara:strand:- start:169 stop:396 length:228 start_codon:yes stop_codon:yes gene_type:complete
VKLEFIELDIEWPSELTVFDLRNYILSKLIKYGEPLRWAITSVTNNSVNKKQIMSVEVVFIVNQDKKKSINPEMN